MLITQRGGESVIQIEGHEGRQPEMVVLCQKQVKPLVDGIRGFLIHLLLWHFWYVRTLDVFIFAAEYCRPHTAELLQ